MAQKPWTGDDATSLNRIFGHLWFSLAKTNDFFESGDKTGQDRYALKIFFTFEIWPFLIWTWPDLGQDMKMTPSNYTFQTTHKNDSHDTLAMFSCSDLIWPDRDLGLYLALASYLHCIFVIPSVASWQGLGLQLYLVWSRQPIKAIRFSFNLRHDLDPTFDLVKKTLRLH